MNGLEGLVGSIREQTKAQLFSDIMNILEEFREKIKNKLLEALEPIDNLDEDEGRKRSPPQSLDLNHEKMNSELPSVTNEAARMRKLFTDPSIVSYSAQLHDGLSEFSDCEHCLHEANSSCQHECIKCHALALADRFESILQSQSSPVESGEDLLLDEGYLKRSLCNNPVATTFSISGQSPPSSSRSFGFDDTRDPIRYADDVELQVAQRFANSSSYDSDQTASSRTTVVEVHVSSTATPQYPKVIPNYGYSSERASRCNSNSPYHNCVGGGKGRSVSSETSEVTMSPSRSPALSPNGSLRRYRFPRDFSQDSNASTMVDEFKIPGDILRRSWIQSNSQMRSPRFHVIFATAVAKSIFSQSELAASNVRGVGVDAPLNPGKMLAIHNAVAKYAGWKKRGEPFFVCQAKLREVDAAINNLCNDAKRCSSRSNNPSPLP